MADRPILFSAPMIRALLAGTKTQTRRLLKPQITKPFGGIFRDGSACWTGDSLTGEVIERLRIPYAPGDRLWVRESFSGPHIYDEQKWKPSTWATSISDAPPLWYWADGNPDWGDFTRPKTSLHMPRWASRLTLTVTEVRVQRLQEISREDAIAEGIQRVGGGALRWENWSGAEGQSGTSPQAAYAMLWTSLHGPGSWEANPWVVAVSFNVRKGNIDD